MNSYYYLQKSAEPEIIGVNNGATQSEILRSGFQDPAKFDFLLKCLGTKYFWEIQKFISDFDFDIQYIKLMPEAHRTNFLTFSPSLIRCPFLISEKTLKVIKNFYLPKVSLHPAIVIDQSKISHKYYLPYIEPLQYDMLDWSKSYFCSGLGWDWVKKDLKQFQSDIERKQFYDDSLGMAYLETACMNERFDKSIDLFSIEAKVYISRRLKNALEEFETTSGIQIWPAYGSVFDWAKINV